MLSIVAAMALQSSASAPETTLLFCLGRAEYSETATSNSHANMDFDVTKSASASSTTTYDTSAAASVSVELSKTGARLRLPSQLIPTIRAGGDNGWWPLNDLKITEAAMTGRMRLNPLNKPKVLIDRRTGEIHISTFGGSFDGVCKRVAAEPLF